MSRRNQGNDEKTFNGKIRLDVRESVADWVPYMPPKAPKGAPNILFVLYDDTGLAAWEPFGGAIQMPTLRELANKGLRYVQWHTAALCSPTRSMLLTGRNHNLNGCAAITEAANGFPGQHARIPEECATVAQILQENGWSTFWVGKNHNVPETDLGAGSTRSQWPLAKGFDRFYGFIGGETSQWYPDLIEDNHSVELPHGHQHGFTNTEGYHLSKDMADKAIQMIKDQKASHPSKPWYMWFCPGANHAPHHAPQNFIDKYWNEEEGRGTGLFDFREGYEKYREWALLRMQTDGIVPKNIDEADLKLNPLEGILHKPIGNATAGQAVANYGDSVLPWAELNADQQKVFAKLMAVYAAFSEYTDYQVGRIVQHLKDTGQFENTVIIYAADNGASGEGSPAGTVNENKFFNGYPESDEENSNLFHEFGGPNTYEHFPTGWAMATSTPFKMFKRYSEYAGGTCDPLVICWPKGIPEEQQGTIREQYHHANDIVPTILDICGLEMPTYHKGVRQYPMSGVSMRYTFAEPSTPSTPENPGAGTTKHRQYYAMLGTRALWEDGWKAVAIHAPLSGHGHFNDDEWELYHVDEDRAELHNLAAEHPEKLKYLINAWFEEAGKNLVLPLDDRGATEVLGLERPTEERGRVHYDYYPGASPVPESVAPNLRGRSFRLTADVRIGQDSKGVIFAHGSRFGGHTLYIEEGKVYYLYNFLGIQKDRTELVWDQTEPGHYQLTVEYQITDQVSTNSVGTFNLYVREVPDVDPGTRSHLTLTLGTKVSSASDRNAQTGKFTLCGDGLCVGYDSADSVRGDNDDEEHTSRGADPFGGGGEIVRVRITPGDELAGVSPRVAAGVFAKD
jgi:arylsulfatase